MTIQERLFEIRDEKYAAFQAKIAPNVPADRFMGVRAPAIRKLVKTLVKEGGYEDFLRDLPHFYFDENILHADLIAEIKDYDACIAAFDRFLPFMDSWAVTDSARPRVFKKHKPELILKIREWAASPLPYTCRFGVGMLMSFFLDDDFDPSYLEIPAVIRSDEYYVNMMTAWFFATALAKQWEATVPYLENRRLDKWTHNKTIQKAVESYRITDEQKTYLRSLKVK